MMLRKMGAVLGTALILILSVAAPAQAHGADAPDATNYRTRITAAPDLAGLTVETIEAGARLQVTNDSGRNVEVLGYQNEPYLEIRPDGVYENIHSPATYLNITIVHVDPPAHADPTLPPEWRKVADEPRWRWHDQRAIWTSLEEPPQVASNPGAPHHIRDWTVPMRVDATPLTLSGTLDYEPPPPGWLWWGLSVLGIAAIALLGLLRNRRRQVGRALALMVIGAGLLGLVYGVARELDAGNDTLWSVVSQLFTAQLWPTVTSLAALAFAIDALLSRKGEGDFAIALGGAAVGLFAGMVNAAAFHRAITPVPMDSNLGRIIIVLIIVLGGGGAAAAMLRLRAGGQTSAEPPAPDPQ
ncbi:MAG TPA: hypothetical protein VF062_19245 [Candidatus Limnocylindrales bacterium]